MAGGHYQWNPSVATFDMYWFLLEWGLAGDHCTRLLPRRPILHPSPLYGFCSPPYCIHHVCLFGLFKRIPLNLQRIPRLRYSSQIWFSFLYAAVSSSMQFMIRDLVAKFIFYDDLNLARQDRIFSLLWIKDEQGWHSGISACRDAIGIDGSERS